MLKKDIQVKAQQYNEVTNSLLNKEQKAEFDKTLNERKAGKLKYYTIEQAKAIINNK